jgi:hypothetical protein
MSSSKRHYFRIIWRDFQGKQVVKYWREGSVSAARTKAQNQGSCREVVSVEVISEEHYTAGAKGQRCTSQFLRTNKKYA